MDYKKEEIKEYFNDHIIDYDKEWIESNSDDLHHEIFNTDYYIIGTYQAIKWLGDMAFDVINHIKDYEQSLFGEVYTDLSDPEKVVNMYTYIIGEEIVADYLKNCWGERVMSKELYCNGYTKDIMKITGFNLRQANKIQDQMECNGLDFSECTNREFEDAVVDTAYQTFYKESA
mgnify:FL=1